jgi:hypothetical protein
MLALNRSQQTYAHQEVPAMKKIVELLDACEAATLKLGLLILTVGKLVEFIRHTLNW